MLVRYRVVEGAEGFRVDHPRHPPIDVAVTSRAFVVESEGRPLGRWALGDVVETATAIVERIRNGPRARRILAPLHTVPHPWMIAGHLFAHRERLLRHEHPAGMGVWEAVAAITRTVPALVLDEALHGEPYVVRDVVALPAAAVALAFVEGELRPPGAEDPAALVRALREWRGLFSPTGRAYRSLNRTLTNLPRGFPARLLCGLRHVRLERPVTDALELATLCIAAPLYARIARPAVAASHLRVLHHATADEIRRAVAQIGAETGRRLSPRRCADLEAVLQALADFPLPHEGRLGGLVERALDWHRVEADTRELVANLGGPATPTRRPPIPLPTLPGVDFLDSVAAVISEAVRMRNCVTSYAPRAVAGECYLFHVAHDGEHACVEVDRHGRVRQAEGPCATRNRATAWARRQLARWGAPLAPVAERVRLETCRPRRRARRRGAGDGGQLALFPP